MVKSSLVTLGLACCFFTRAAAGSFSGPCYIPSFNSVERLCGSRNVQPNVPRSFAPVKRDRLRTIPLSSQRRSHSTCFLNVSEEVDDVVDSDQDTSRWTPLSLQSKILLPLQLVFSVYLLLLLPSGLALHKLCGANIMETLPYEYIGFLSLLIMPRAYKYGKFAKKPVSSAKATSVREVVVFIAALVGSHWRAAYHYARSSKGMFAPMTLFTIRFCSLVLVTWSGWHLGKSYDRVTRPDSLVQSGPYAIVRHPIYTCYLLLFSSTLLTLRSFGAYGVFLLVSCLFYSRRMDSEDQLLEEEFGDEFTKYKSKVPWRLLPFLY